MISLWRSISSSISFSSVRASELYSRLAIFTSETSVVHDSMPNTSNSSMHNSTTMQAEPIPSSAKRFFENTLNFFSRNICAMKKLTTPTASIAHNVITNSLVPETVPWKMDPNTIPPSSALQIVTHQRNTGLTHPMEIRSPADSILRLRYAKSASAISTKETST